MNIFDKRNIYIETYGCQMNFSDSEIVVSIMRDSGYTLADDAKKASVILVNTCSIRENAEQRVRNRIQEFKSLKKRNPQLIIGIIGCMAERLKTALLEEEPFIDMIVGPDAYRELPNLLKEVESGLKGVNILLSHQETYSDLNPVRLDGKGVSAFISIMRGCQNFCSYCVVPYTRGKERSRNANSIIKEAENLFKDGYREVTLLGQNVNSYNDNSLNFSGLMALVASVNPLLRVRFATSHPKDMSDELLETIAKYPNICKSVHLPVQSGSTRILEKMNRKYTREWYLNRIKAIRTIIKDCSITTDIISGFCTETDEDHKLTLSLMEEVRFDFAYMFKYSERAGTYAASNYPDDVSEEVKNKRLQEIIELQNHLSLKSNRNDVGKTFEVLAEGFSKRSSEFISGRNTQNKMIIFPKGNYKSGDYVNVIVKDCTSASLKGIAV